MSGASKQIETAEQLITRKLIQAEEIRVQIAKEDEILVCVSEQLGKMHIARHKMSVAAGVLHRLLNQDWFETEKEKYRLQMESAADAIMGCHPNAERKATNRITEFRKAISRTDK